MGRDVRVAVQLGDISRLAVDVIAVKYPGGLLGTAGVVAKAIGIGDDEIRRSLPSVGSLHVVPGRNRIGAGEVAFLHVVPLASFGYDQIQQFSFDVLRGLRSRSPRARQVGLTLHGVMFGMNLERSLLAELKGCVAAVQAGECPPGLEQITIVNRDAEQVRRLQQVIAKVLPAGTIEAPESVQAPEVPGTGFDVFISYKSEDWEPARQVFAFLQSHGLKVFFSRESLPRLGSDEYHAQIDRAIEQAQHMVVVTTSPAHATAPWVEYEWRLFLGERLARRKAGNLITVIAGDMRIHDLPISLRNREVIGCDPAELPKLLKYTGGGADEPPRQQASTARVISISDFLLSRAELLNNVSWTAARDHAEGLSIEGERGWRLPTLDQLRQIRRSTTLVQAELCYWSDEEAGDGEAFYMHFDDGHVGRAPKSFAGGLCAVFVKPNDAQLASTR